VVPEIKTPVPQCMFRVLLLVHSGQTVRGFVTYCACAGDERISVRTNMSIERKERKWGGSETHNIWERGKKRYLQFRRFPGSARSPSGIGNAYGGNNFSFCMTLEGLH
jgi:hypothetical protein